MKKTLLTLGALGAFTIASNAASIGISFGGDNQGGGNAFLAPTDTAGVISQSNWNNATGITGAAVDVIDDAGAASTMDVTWDSGESWSWNTPVGTSEGRLESGWISRNTIGQAVTVGLAEIPYATYDLYLYVGHDRSGGGSPVMTFTELGGAFADFTITEGVEAADLAADPFTYIEGTGGTGNYALISGLTSSNLNLSVVSTNDRIGFAGFQIVQVPEPSAALFVGIAGLAMIFRRRKK